MLREGIEDYEMLYLLRDLIRQRREQLSPQRVAELEKLLEVPADITENKIRFTTDSAPIYRHRAAVAEAIEQFFPAQ